MELNGALENQIKSILEILKKKISMKFSNNGEGGEGRVDSVSCHYNSIKYFLYLNT